MLNRMQRKVLFLSSLGGILEFYDFIIYALVASYLATEFFPLANRVASLLTTFATFSVGYLVRPLGGVIFGHFGDKYGRKRSFTFSILLMACATFLIAFVPSYARIGIAAPILLTLLRLLQGFSLGGEIPGAIAYISESIVERKGLGIGILFCCLLFGMVFGSLLQSILASCLTPLQMQSFGWRVLFIVGGLFGFVTYHLRQDLEESKIFKSIDNKIHAVPVIALFKKSSANTLSGIFFVALVASIITLLFLFMPAYLDKVMQQSSPAYVWVKTAAVFVAALLCIIFGYCTDKYSHRALVAVISAATIILIYPIFAIYETAFAWYWVALLFSALLLGLSSGVIPPILGDLFPTSYRYSGIAVSYNLGFALFGGLTPVIANYLVYATGAAIAPMFYLIGTALLSCLGLVIMRKVKH